MYILQFTVSAFAAKVRSGQGFYSYRCNMLVLILATSIAKLKVKILHRDIKVHRELRTYLRIQKPDSSWAESPPDTTQRYLVF